MPSEQKTKLSLKETDRRQVTCLLKYQRWDLNPGHQALASVLGAPTLDPDEAKLVCDAREVQVMSVTIAPGNGQIPFPGARDECNRRLPPIP